MNPSIEGSCLRGFMLRGDLYYGIQNSWILDFNKEWYVAIIKKKNYPFSSIQAFY